MGYMVSRDDGWRLPDWLRERIEPLLPERPAHRRFQEWRKAGVFQEIWRQGLLEYDERVGIDWEWLAADGAMTKSPLGGPKTGPNPTDRAKRGPNGRSSPRVRVSRSDSTRTAQTATTISC